MLDGIHILNKTMVTEIPDWAITILFVGIFAALLGSILACNAKTYVVEIIFSIIAIAGGVCFMFVGIKQPEVETGRYQYEVIVDETVSFNDICEKYEVKE